MPSPTCEVKDGSGAWQSTTNGVVVTPGNVISVRLANVADVNIWELDAVGSDEETDFTAIAVAVDMVTKTATFTQPAGADVMRTILFQSRINQGRNSNRTRNASLTTTFGVFVEGEGGDRVLATNERFETDAVYGWIVDLNRRTRRGNCGAQITDSDWYLDPVNGDDTNDGLSALTPCRTWAHIRDTIWGCGARLMQWTYVHIMSSQPDDTDPLDTLDGKLHTFYGLTFTAYGYQSTVRSGTITALTTRNRDTNVPWDMTDSGQAGTWTTDLLQRVCIVGGDRDGDTAFVAKDLGTKKCRISGFVHHYDYAQSTPQVGDAYEVQALPSVYNTTNSPAFVVEFEMVTMESQWLWRNVANYYDCIFVNYFDSRSSDSTFYNCCFRSGLRAFERSSAYIHSGLVAHIGIFVQGVLWLLHDVMMHDSTEGLLVLAGSHVRIHRFCIYNSAVADGAGIIRIGGGYGDFTDEGGVQMLPGAGVVEMFSTKVAGVDQADAALYGSGNTGPVVHAWTGGRFSAPANRPPTVTGSGATNFWLHNSTTAHGWNSATAVYTAAISCTWTNLALSIGGGGFGGSAHNVGQDAHITLI